MIACFLYELDHPEGVIRGSSAIHSIEWNGHLWQGLGAVASFDPMEVAAAVEVPERTYRLAYALPQIQADIASDIEGRSFKVWHAILDTRGRVVDAVLEESMITDTADLVFEDDGACWIELRAWAGLHELNAAPEAFWTPQEHRAIWPDDSGLDNIPDLVNRTANWQPL